MTGNEDMMELTSLASSSEGNSIFVGTKNTKVLVDCGISAKRIENSLKELGMKASQMDAILVTHEHSDHIKGLGVMARRYGIPMFATSGTIDAMLSSGKIGEVSHDLFYGVEADRSFTLGDMIVNPTRISHDAAEPVCYSFEADDVKASIATDLGDYDDYIIEKLKDSNILFVEANHDVNMLQVGRYPYYLKQRILGSKGHLSNDRCACLLNDVISDCTSHVYLGHLSKENNYAQLAYETVKTELKMQDISLEVAKRDQVSTLTNVIS